MRDQSNSVDDDRASIDGAESASGSTRDRQPVAATARVVSPYLYEVLWSIAHYGPLTAQEIADNHNRPLSVPDYRHWTPQAAANRMRSTVRLGLVERDHEGFYLLTAEGREWITIGAERRP